MTRIKNEHEKSRYCSKCMSTVLYTSQDVKIKRNENYVGCGDKIQYIIYPKCGKEITHLESGKYLI